MKENGGNNLDFMAGGGDMGARIRAHDWTLSPLGPPESWPQSLRTVVNILLTSRYSMWMGWGADLTFFYNDAYAPTLGVKHGRALGRNSRDVWAEIWPDIGPRIGRVLRTGEATWDEGLLLFLERSGYPEETYHTFSYSPLRNDDGAIAGHLCVVTEETERVIGERRLDTLRDLAAGLAAASGEEEVLAAVGRSLGANARDLPFTVTYLFEGEDGAARLAARTGMPAGHPAAPPRIDPAEPGAGWPAAALWSGAGAQEIEDLAARFPGLPTGAWQRPPERALVVPIVQPGQEHPVGFLAAGLNPHRRPDDAYTDFIGLIAGQVASALANARAHEAERRRAEMLTELDRVKTAFFSNVSHEFRTPLTLMLAPLEDALSDSTPGVLSAVQRDRLDVAHRNSLRLLRLVNTLLDFSRIEAGRVQASFEPTDLAALTAELASNFRSATERAGLTLTVDCPTLPAPVYVDRESWEKIVLNLLSNAFKFTFAGGITVRLAAEGDEAVLTVRDTGVGIPEAELPRLFERFHRIEGQRSRSFEGTGIGLALIQELVRLHHGAILAESRPGEGTCFTVRMPFGTAHLPAERIGSPSALAVTVTRADAFVEEALRWLPDAVPETAAPAALPVDLPAVPDGPRPRIVLADDNADMRDYVRRLLAGRYAVTAVADGQAALAEIRRRRPDLLLTDVMMPVLDGFALLRTLRADPALKDLPVILLSARAGEEARAEGLDAGADDYLIKPFSARELVARIGANLAMARVREEAAQALRARTAELETVLETVPTAVWFTYAADAAEVTGNRQAMRLLRLPEGGNASLSAPAAQRPRHFRVFQDGVELPATSLPIQRAARGEEVRNEEQEVRFDDGTSVVLLMQATPLRDRAGRIVGAVAAAGDITERKRAERDLRLAAQMLEARVAERTAALEAAAERIRESEARLRTVFVNSTECLFLLRVDPERGPVFIDANPAAEHVLGHDRAEVAGHTPQELLGPEAAADVGFHLAACLHADGVPYRYTARRDYGGLQTELEVVAIALDGPGGERLIMVTARDVTGQRALEEQLRQSQKMEAIGQLTGGIAHDFNNLLTGISGSLEMLQTRAEQGRVADLPRYTAAAMAAVTRAAALTHRLLAFARRQALDPKPTNVNRLVASMEELIIRTVGPSIRVETVLSGGLWPTLCDANQLENALLNLCINARDAMPEGGRLTIETANTWLDDAYAAAQRDVRPGQYVSLSVTDTGHGMAPEVMARAFDPFFTTKPLGQGTGLGLSMLYGFIRQSEGHVRIYSEVGQGTTIRIYLPRHHAAADAEPDGMVPHAAQNHAGAGETVLVVEDEAIVRSLVVEVLEDLGYAALEAGDGPSGLRILESRARVDLLVTDVGLPGMNGRQLAEAARQSRPGLKVLFITGYAHNAAIGNGFLEPGMEMVAKPFALDVLAARIRAMIESRPGASGGR